MTYFLLCLALGRLLRAGRYSKTRIVVHDGGCEVRKSRRFYAPLLIWIGRPLMTILDTGVRILPRREWEAREREIYQTVHGASMRIDADGTLVLPCLTGETLATLLENPRLEPSVRMRAIELAVVALAAFHRLGFTHGDAMADNVMVDLDADAAHWFDFETEHDARRPTAWRRADDVRALLMTCVIRTLPEQRDETVRFILDRYAEVADVGVTDLLATSFSSLFQRALPFHLAQAPMSVQCHREIARVMRGPETS